MLRICRYSIGTKYKLTVCYFGLARLVFEVQTADYKDDGIIWGGQQVHGVDLEDGSLFPGRFVDFPSVVLFLHNWEFLAFARLSFCSPFI